MPQKLVKSQKLVESHSSLVFFNDLRHCDQIFGLNFNKMVKLLSFFDQTEEDVIDQRDSWPVKKSASSIPASEICETLSFFICKVRKAEICEYFGANVY